MLDEEDQKPKTYEQIRREWVHGEIANWSGERDPSKHQYSEYKRALDALTTSATEYGMRVNASTTWEGELSFQDVLAEAIDVLSDLRFAVGADEGEDGEKLRLWSHRLQPLYDLKVKKTPGIVRSDVELVVARYLRLPYRSAPIDRLLVDLLVATELYAYGNETINAPSIPGITSTSPLKRRPIVEWLVANLIGVGLWIVVGGAFWLLSLVHLFPKSWLGGLNVILGFIFIACLIWSAIWLPRNWWLVHKAKRKIIELLDAMNGLYAELHSAGPISARHIEHRARSTADAGVVWPAPLFVMLDDINRRDGKF